MSADDRPPTGSEMSQTGIVQKLNVPATTPSTELRPQTRLIGQMLVERGAMTEDQVERVLDYQKQNGGRFGEIAVKLKLATRKDIEDALAIQFGYTPADSSSNRLPAKVVAAFNPYSPFAEALRGLRSQLMLRWFDGSPAQSALAITSVDRGDGKSFIAANLAVLFAQLGERTLLIDADLRHPTQDKIFGIPNRMGLSGLLAGRAGEEEIVRQPHLNGLAVLPSGPLPPNPQELLGRDEFGMLLNEMSNHFDVILVDTPSAQQASDAQVIAQRTRGALLVGLKGKTKSSELAQLAAILGSSGIQILGATLNEY